MNFRLILLLVSLTLVAPCWSQINSSGSISQPTVNQSTFNKEAAKAKENATKAAPKSKEKSPDTKRKASPKKGKVIQAEQPFQRKTCWTLANGLLWFLASPLTKCEWITSTGIGITSAMDGFKRIMQNGMICADHHFGYAPTYTGPGHASIYTGTTPRFHGVISNYWYDRKSAETVYCAADASVQAVGLDDGAIEAGHMSPHRMHASTLGDELKLSTDLKAKVYGISLKDRGAILPAGHLADGAFWFYGKDQGKFITSTYYMDELPQWLDSWNGKNMARRYLKSNWLLSLPEKEYSQAWPDNNPYESNFKGGMRPTFPYDLESLQAENGGFDIIQGNSPWQHHPGRLGHSPDST